MSDRRARAFVWSVWFVMLLVCVVALLRYGRNIPQAEDWLLVPTLTGNEPHVWRFLWAPNNEHRTPVPRLLLLGLLKLAHGDFRIGMVLNVAMLAGLSAALIRTARSVRGGMTRYADACFPVALLHLGHWENLFWSWQATLVFAVIPVTAVLLLLVSDPGFTTRRSALWGGLAVALLPLSGANGLFFAPFFAGWLAYCGVLRWRERRPPAVVLIVSAVVGFGLSGLYFVGFERPSWVPPNPGLGPSLVAAAQFLALAFGPVARSSWVLSTAAAAGVFVLAAAMAAVGLARARGRERDRALGMLMFLASVALFALAMGWGRAGVVAMEGAWPIRYSLLAVPLLLAAFFTWQLYATPRAGALLQNALLAVMLVLIPLNTRHGLWWGSWSLAGATAVERDVAAGASEWDVADAHGAYLYHALDPAEVARRMRMLKSARLGPWVHLGEDETVPIGAVAPVLQPFRYRRGGAARVVLVWGIDGWRLVPEALRPEGTSIRGGVMHTPMDSVDEEFVATVEAPAGATVDYGFLTTPAAGNSIKPVWDGGYSVVASGRGPVERDAPAIGTSESDPRGGPPLEAREIRYRMPGAGEVFLVWGVDGWRTVPRATRYGETVVAPAGRGSDGAQVMRIRMERRGDVFSARIHPPVGATLDYGFLITDKRGILDLVAPLWDGPASVEPEELARTGTLEVDSTVTLPDEWAEARDYWRHSVAGVLLLLGTWAILYSALGLFDRRGGIMRPRTVVRTSEP